MPGYLGLTRASNDAEHINPPDFDPFSIWRNRLSEDDEIEYLPTWLSRGGFEPERVQGQWLVDVTHLVLYKTPQGHKCISPSALEGRFDQMRTQFGDRMWAANPDDVVRYTTCDVTVTLPSAKSRSIMPPSPWNFLISRRRSKKAS